MSRVWVALKRIASFFCGLLILISFVGCSHSATVTEPTTNTKAEKAITPATSPEPTPTLSEFDVNDVEMQSTPDSTCFSKVGYDSDWNVLVVEFRDSGSIYTYSDFPKSEWNEFVSADSLGGWYNSYIKGQYECQRIC